MPYRVNRPGDRQYPGLVDELAAELRKGEHEDAGGPDITEDIVPLSGSRQVTVIWDEFDQIMPETRGRIILNAYEVALGHDTMRSIGLAIGLTRGEAGRLGLFDPVG